MRMLTRSPSFRLISAGEPAPSSTTTSCAAARRSKLSRTSGNRSRTLSRKNSAAVTVRQIRPFTTTCAPTSVDGLMRIGFIVDRRRNAAGFRLHRLRAADLQTIGRRRGIERHVLRLERRHAQSAIDENAAERRRQHGFADVRRGPQHHQRAAHRRTGREREQRAAARRGELFDVDARRPRVSLPAPANRARRADRGDRARFHQHGVRGVGRGRVQVVQRHRLRRGPRRPACGTTSARRARARYRDSRSVRRAGSSPLPSPGCAR